MKSLSVPILAGLDRRRPCQVGAADEEVSCRDAREVGEDCGGDGAAPVGDHQDGQAGQGRRISGEHGFISPS